MNLSDEEGETPGQCYVSHLKSTTNPIHDEDFDVSEIEKTLTAFLNKGTDINHVNVFGDTMLHQAAKTWPEVVDLIIKHGGDKNIKNNVGRNSLHTCVIQTKRSSNEADTSKIKQTCKALIKHGVSVNEPDINGATPLHQAINKHSYEVSEMLIEEGADVNAADKCGTVPLHTAMAWSEHLNRVVHLLLSHGADRYAVDANGSTVAHYAAWEKKGPNICAAEAVISLNVDLDIVDTKGNTAIDVATFIQNVFFVKALGRETGSDNDESFEINTFVPITIEEIPDHVKQFRKYHKNLDKLILQNPNFDRVANSDEAKFVQENIHDLVKLLLKKIAEKDPRFEAVAILSGSVSESTKIDLPDEFDYICCLQNFDLITTVDESDLDKHPCFASLVRTNGGQIPQRKDEDYAEFFNGRFLEQNAISTHFYQLIRKVVSDPDIWSRFTRLHFLQEPKVEKGKIHSLSVQWNGWLIKNMAVSIDLVPAVPKRHWRPSQMQPDGCLLITKRDNTERHEVESDQKLATLLRISFSETETRLLQNQSEEVRSGYKLAKYIIDLVPPLRVSRSDHTMNVYNIDKRKLISSYMLKTCLLHLIEKNFNSGPLIDDRLPDTEKIQSWAFLIYQQLEKVLEATERKLVPSYFFPEYSIIPVKLSYIDLHGEQRRLFYCKMIKQMLEPVKHANIPSDIWRWKNVLI